LTLFGNILEGLIALVENWVVFLLSVWDVWCFCVWTSSTLMSEGVANMWGVGFGLLVSFIMFRDFIVVKVPKIIQESPEHIMVSLFQKSLCINIPRVKFFLQSQVLKYRLIISIDIWLLFRFSMNPFDDVLVAALNSVDDVRENYAVLANFMELSFQAFNSFFD